MADVVYLKPGEQPPHFNDGELWITVEASDDGRFFGTGFGRKPSGEAVFYASIPEHDRDLATALTAAQEWAAAQAVPCIWVQTTPWESDEDAS